MKKIIAKAFILLAIIIPILVAWSYGASQGPNSPTISANDMTVGLTPWLNTDNSFASDTAHSTATVGIGLDPSYYLVVTGFGFSIPTGSTINGVLVEIQQVNGSVTGVKENSVKLVKGGAISGNDKSTAAILPTPKAYVSYGGSSDLWGNTLTVSDVNASNFGVGFSIARNAGSAPSGGVDHVRMTIDYTAPKDGVQSSGVHFAGCGIN